MFRLLSARGAVLLMCGLLAGMLLLDLHKVSIAIPAIERALHPGPVGIQLVSAAYVVCFALTLIPAGRFGDRGHRIGLTAAGLGLYLAASALCTLAPSIAWVVVGRAVLGVAAGILMPQAMALVQALFTGPDRARAFGVYGVCVSLATALGPSVGGLLVTLGGPVNGWRGVFALNLPIGLLLAVAAAILLPWVRRTTPLPSSGDGRGDLLGLVLGGGALVALLLPFILTTGRPGDVAARWLLLVPAALLAAAFVARSRARARRGEPTVVDVTLLRIPSFRNGVLVSLTWFASGPAFTLALTIVLQTALGLTPLQAGLLLLPSAASSAVGAALGGRHVARLGRRLTAAGMTISAVATIGTALVLALAAPVALVAVPLLQFLGGFGGGLVVSPNHSQMLAEVPREKGGAASSLGQLGQRISNSVGVAIASVAFFATIYGAGATLDDAGRDLELTALGRATLVSLAFLVVALSIALLDLRRQRAAALVPAPAPAP